MNAIHHVITSGRLHITTNGLVTATSCITLTKSGLNFGADKDANRNA